MEPLDQLTSHFGFYFTDYGKHQLTLLVISVVIVIVLVVVVKSFLGGTSRPPKTIEDMAQEAAWLRARGNLAEAEQDYKLKQAALQQTENFIKQNIRK